MVQLWFNHGLLVVQLWFRLVLIYLYKQTDNPKENETTAQASVVPPLRQVYQQEKEKASLVLDANHFKKHILSCKQLSISLIHYI